MKTFKEIFSEHHSLHITNQEDYDAIVKILYAYGYSKYSESCAKYNYLRQHMVIYDSKILIFNTFENVEILSYTSIDISEIMSLQILDYYEIY